MDYRVIQRQFGRTRQGERVNLYTVLGENCQFSVSEYGAALVSLLVRDRAWRFRDIVLGFDSVGPYELDQHYLGATLGRIAGVISNACFKINETLYRLENSEPQHFHGGTYGFSKQIWHGEAIDSGVRMSLFSRDDSGGYPGNLKVTVTYMFESSDCLAIHYSAISDADTYVNLSNHAYFNLNGHSSGSCREHLLQVNARHFVPVDLDQVPSGKICVCKNTPFDFSEWQRLGDRITSPCRQIQQMNGLDHYFMLDDGHDLKLPAAQLFSPESGIQMTLYTSKPGLYIYSGNSLGDPPLLGKRHCCYGHYAGVALEPQYYPDGPNQTDFVCPVLRAFEPYEHVTRYRFEVAERQ